MRRAVLVVTMVAAFVVCVATFGWTAPGTKIPAPRAATVTALTNVGSAEGAQTDSTVGTAALPRFGGFCLNIDRDEKWLCVLRRQPNDPGTGRCRAILSVGGLVTYTNCTAKEPR